MGICFGIGYELHMGLSFHAALAADSSGMTGYIVTLDYNRPSAKIYSVPTRG